MAVITFSNEIGSLGTQVADRVAHTLQYRLADKSTIGAILNEYGMDDFEEEYKAIPGFWERLDVPKMKHRAFLFAMLNRCLQALAREGDLVIVGRGGFAALGGLADVLNVRIQAPWRIRARRLVDAPAVADPSLAERVVPETDQRQKAFIKSVYGKDLDAASDFDLVINTGRIAPELAADLVVQAARALPRGAGSPEGTTRDLEVDPILAETCRSALDRQLTLIG
jgi:cytidylate kinase